MAAVVSSTLAASAWMFSTTSSFVAAISRIDEDDSSALWARTSTLSAMPLSDAIIWPIEDEVSTTRAVTVPAQVETADPVDHRGHAPGDVLDAGQGDGEVLADPVQRLGQGPELVVPELAGTRGEI